jgi:hypothetical protein
MILIDLEIRTKFDVTSANFTLSDGKDEDPEDDGLRKRQQTDSKTSNPKKENKASTFRPFGIFEPQSVKIARKNIQSVGVGGIGGRHFQ